MGSQILSGRPLFSPEGDADSRHSEAKATPGFLASSEDGDFVYIGMASNSATVNSGEPVSAGAGLSACVRGDSDAGAFLGIANAPISSGEFGFIRRSGPVTAYVASGAVAGTPLELSGTAGQLKPLTSSGQQVGIALASSPNGAGLTSVYLNGN